MILVTGATGHIGNVLVRELRKQGYPVRALVLPGESLKPIEGIDLEIVEGNILDPASLTRAMQGVEGVFHLAGIISIMPGDDERVYKVNVEGTKNVIRAAREAGATVVAVATIADRATGAAGVFAEAGLEYRFVYGLAELGLA